MTQAEGMRGGYDTRDFGRGPKTYSDEGFVDKIFAASGIGERTGLLVVDLMSGPGKLGQAIEKRAPENRYLFLDRSHPQLAKIGGNHYRLLADALTTVIRPEVADVVLARYAIKDFPPAQQTDVVQRARVMLKPGGVLVIADMVTTPVNKEWLNEQHSLKQVFSGRNTEREGKCHIPTEEEWIKMLEDAGFDASVSDTHISFVDTIDWLNGNQVTQAQLEELNRMIVSAPQAVKDSLNIRSEDSHVKLDYPLIIVRGVKR